MISLVASRCECFPILGLALATFALAGSIVDVCDGAEMEHMASLYNGVLRAVVADNEPYGDRHQPGYNGISELYLGLAGQKDLFVPLYAGLNFEHVFSGDSTSYGWHIFEPRRARMQLVRASTNRVELLQERTEHWPLRSRLIYEFNGDALDFTYTGIPLADVWKKHRYIGVFFASLPGCRSVNKSRGAQ